MNKKVLTRIKKIVQALSGVLIILACGLLGMFLAVKDHVPGPEECVDEYFTYFAMQEWLNMYNMTDIEKGKFLDEEFFELKMNNDKLDAGVIEYDIIELESSDGVVSYKIEYIDSNNKPGEYYIDVKKQKKKAYVVFPTWKASMRKEVVSNIALKAEIGLTLYLDDEDLTDYLNGANDGIVSYTIEKLFKGKHKISIVDEQGDTTNKTIDITKSGQIIDFTKADLDLGTAHQEALNKASLDILMEFYQNAMLEEKVDTIEPFFLNDEETINALTNAYEVFRKEVVKDDGNALTNIDLTKVNYELVEYIYPDKASIKIDFDVNYAAIPELSILHGYREEYQGTTKGSCTIHFDFKEKWLANRIEISCFDYTKVETEQESETFPQ